MTPKRTAGAWKAVHEGGKWEIRSMQGTVVARVEEPGNALADAKLIAASPIMFEALSGLIQLIGEEDLPDNGELSGAAICDLARSAIAMAIGKAS